MQYKVQYFPNDSKYINITFTFKAIKKSDITPLLNIKPFKNKCKVDFLFSFFLHHKSP